MSETVEDIVRDIRRRAEVAIRQDEDATVHHSAVGALLHDIADRIEAAHVHEVNHMLKIDNACVAQCAVLLDDHIKAIVAEVKRRANNGNG